MALFDELDVDGTYHAVQWFFYDRYPVIKRRSGAWDDYSSPSLDGMPKAPSAGNTSEKSMIQHSTYASAYYAVQYAIRGCSHDSQIIIKGKYIGNLSDDQVRARLLINGNGAFRRRVKRACCEFADCIDPACEKFNVQRGEHDLIPKLRKYLKARAPRN